MIRRLPEELLVRILSYFQRTVRPPINLVEDSYQRKTLLSASLVNKAFNRAVRRSFYHTYSVRTPADIGIDIFLNTIICAPATAALVREIHVQPFEPRYEEYDYDGNLHILLRPAHRNFLDAAQRADCSSELRDLLIEGLTRGTQDSKIALLLCLCKQLEILELGRCEHTVLPLTESVLHEMTGRYPNTFRIPSQLREVGVYNWLYDGRGITDLAQSASLLELPALEMFRATNFCSASDSEMPFLAIQQSVVKKAVFQECLMDAFGFRQILLACSQVEDLTVEWGCISTANPDVDFEDIGRTLQQHGSHLRSLVFKPYSEGYFQVIEPPYQPIGSLRSLDQLKTLTIPAHVLFGDRHDEDAMSDAEDDYEPPNVAELLPFSLKSLELPYTEYFEDSELLQEFLFRIMRDNRFSELRTIQVERTTPFSNRLASFPWDDSLSNDEWVILTKLKA